MPFEEDEADLGKTPEQKVTLKGQRTPVSPLNQTKEFNAAAKSAHENETQIKSEILTLSKRFVELMRDKTLVDNKGQIAKNLENQLVNELGSLGVRVNNDPSIAEEGMGSIGLITLLLKTVISQRDKINSLEFRMHKLEKSQTVVSSRDPQSTDTDTKPST